MKRIPTCIAVVWMLICSFTAFQASAQTLTDKFIGNWINRTTNNWEYGFFETFAIYQNDFWDYESVVSNKKGTANVVLTKGKERLSLKLQLGKDSMLSVQNGKGKATVFVKMKKGYPDYPQKDESFFRKRTFRQDSATIIGYYRNREKVPEQFTSRFVKPPFSVQVLNVVKDQDEKYLADFDSLGRFRLTIPILDIQELDVDWERFPQTFLMEAGDTIFLFADMVDFIPLEKDESMKGYYLRPKELLLMGDNARLNNELNAYVAPRLYYDRNRGNTGSDMDFLTYCDSVYQIRMSALNHYMMVHPTVSKKCLAFLSETERFNLLNNLINYRFTASGKGQNHLDELYVSHIRRMAVQDEEWMYTGLSSFSDFMRNWIWYQRDVKNGIAQILLTFGEIRDYIRLHKRVSAETLELLDKLAVMNEAFEHAKPEALEALRKKYKDLQTEGQTLSPLMNETAYEILAKRPLDTSLTDSLIHNENLRRIWDANTYYAQINRDRRPFSSEQLQFMREKVVYPSLVSQLETIHHFYENTSKSGMTYEASLKNTEHLKEYKDAKVLFEELIKPYKGKVIYVDFWGTWCAPCKRNMKYVKGIKEKLKDQPVVFMYFANSSSEESWKNVIKEMDLTGENVVHFRLPDPQQAMIERMFKVTSFPKYLLINKEGIVVNIDAKSPMFGEEMLKEIGELF